MFLKQTSSNTDSKHVTWSYFHVRSVDVTLDFTFGHMVQGQLVCVNVVTCTSSSITFLKHMQFRISWSGENINNRFRPCCQYNIVLTCSTDILTVRSWFCSIPKLTSGYYIVLRGGLRVMQTRNTLNEVLAMVTSDLTFWQIWRSFSAY